MKNLISKIKGANYKQLLIDHFEKMIAGFLAVFAVWALSGTNWMPYLNTPQQIKDKVEKVRDDTKKNSWPEAERQKFTIVNYPLMAEELVRPPSVAAFDFSIPLSTPLYKKQELARDPDYLVVEDLIADVDYAPLEVSTKGPEELEGAGDAMAENQSEDEDNAFAPRRPGGGGAMAEGAPGMMGPGLGAGRPGGRSPFPGPGTGGSGPFPGPQAGAGPPSGMPNGGMAMNEMMGGMMGGPGGGGGGGAIQARGERFIALRGIFNLSEQIKRYMRALHITEQEARQEFEITNFILERQAAVAGPNPWTGPWETVSIDKAREVIADTNLDDEVVNPQIIDDTIAMPLPRRLMGTWDKLGSHDRIKHYTLTPEEQERMTRMQEALVAEMERQNVAIEAAKKKQGGFKGAKRDVRGGAAQLFGGGGMFNGQQAASNIFQQMTAGNQNADGAAPGAGGQIREDDIRNLRLQFTAVGNLLLFRYLDFDIRPGYAYRYRVKLVVKNPNYGKDISQVVNHELVREEERETGYSNISNPLSVPISQNYFLTQVPRDPTRDYRSTRKPVATIKFVEWDNKMGTLVNDNIDVKSVGMFLNEKKKTTRIDPANIEVRSEEYEFSSSDVLLDAVPDFDIKPEEHPLLGLEAKPRSATSAKVGLLERRLGGPDDALVLTPSGSIRVLDNQTQQLVKSRLERDFQLMKEAFGGKDADDKTDGKPGTKPKKSAEMSMPPGMEFMMGGGAQPIAPRSQRRNANGLRNPGFAGGAGGRGGSAAGGAGMMPPMMMGPMQGAGPGRPGGAGAPATPGGTTGRPRR